MIAKLSSSKLLWLIVAFFITNVFCAPTHERPPPPVIREGSVISVKPTAFEAKRTAAGASIHPGVVAYISGGKYLIAMVSKKLPLNPPQKEFSLMKTGTTMYGNINLAFGQLKEVNLDDLRPWMNDARTEYEAPMTPPQLNALRAELVKNKSWKPEEGAQLDPYARKRKHQIPDPHPIGSGVGQGQLNPGSSKRQRRDGKNGETTSDRMVVAPNPTRAMRRRVAYSVQ